MTTYEELQKMTTAEKIKRYAFDVVETEEETTEDDRNFYRYDFLFGAGSLGYPIGESSPTPIGKAVNRIANDLSISVRWNMENSYADFSEKITQEVVAKHFRLIWEESDRRKKLDGAH